MQVPQHIPKPFCAPPPPPPKKRIEAQVPQSVLEHCVGPLTLQMQGPQHIPKLFCAPTPHPTHTQAQVPQYILERAIARGEGAACNIVCTQPRRISAVGLAGRVAQERGERVGEVVGYSVRLDSKQSARTRLLFCTTGGLGAGLGAG